MKRMLAIVTAAVVVGVTANADAYSRNLSSPFWRTPQGDTFSVVHDVRSAAAEFSTTGDSDATGAVSLNFHGRVSDGSKRGSFFYRGYAKSFPIMINGVLCTVETPKMEATGTMLGKFGGRRIHMAKCALSALIYCDDEATGKRQLVRNWIHRCDGVWR